MGGLYPLTIIVVGEKKKKNRGLKEQCSSAPVYTAPLLHASPLITSNFELEFEFNPSSNETKISMLCHINGRIVTQCMKHVNTSNKHSLWGSHNKPNWFTVFFIFYFGYLWCNFCVPLCNYGQNLDPNLFGLIFSSTHYVANYKIIYVYYLNKLHDL